MNVNRLFGGCCSNILEKSFDHIAGMYLSINLVSVSGWTRLDYV